jgi:hypothetical protein
MNHVRGNTSRSPVVSIYSRAPEQEIPLYGASGTLGLDTPTGFQRTRDFFDAFEAGRALAIELAVAGEADPPDMKIWLEALKVLSAYAPFVNEPMVSPLQLGGVSFEWHVHGLNIELRFRGVNDVFVVIEDAKDTLAEFLGRDPGLGKARAALMALANRLN